MKRIASTFLLVLFLFSTCGYYLLFIILDSSNRNEIQGSLFHETSLKTLKVHNSDLKNVIFKDEGKEILLNGEMYDVKSTVQDGEYILFHCKHDKKETILLAGLDNHVKQNSDSKSSDKKGNSKSPVKDLFFSGTVFLTFHSSFMMIPIINRKLPIADLSLPALPPEVSIA